ncbi:MAG: flippase [bacterium]
MNAARLAPQIINNSLILFLGKIASVGIGVVATMVLVRHISVSDFGRYAFTFSFISFFNVLLDFGVVMIATREISRDLSSASTALGNLILFRLVWAIALMAAAAGVAVALGYPRDVQMLVFIASFTLLFSSFSILEVIFRVNLKMIYSVLAGTAGALIAGTSLIICVLFLKMSLTGLIIVNTVCAAVPAILMLIFSKKFVKLKLRLNIPQLRNILMESFPQGIATFLSALYFNADIILVSKLAGDASVAYYSSAYKILSMVVFIPSAVMTTVFPLLSRNSGEPEALKQIFQKTFYYLQLIGIPVAALLMIYSRNVIVFLFSQKYIASVEALNILAWAGAIIFGSTLLGYALVAINRQNLGIIIASLGLILNVALNLWWIPRYDFIGAAMATVATESLIAFLLLFVVQRYSGMLPFSRRLIKAPILGLLFSVFIIFLKNINLTLSLVAIIPLYAILLKTLRCYQDDFSVPELIRSFLNPGEKKAVETHA